MKYLYKTLIFFTFVIFILTSYIYIDFDVKEIRKIFEDRYSVSVLDNKDNIIGVYLNKDEQWHLKSEEEIPKKLKLAVTTYEDKNFYSHRGVDSLAILRAFYNNIKDKRRTGASTITMQVAKNINHKKRTYLNKYLEIVRAFKIERYFSKDEILKMYLNNAPYGGNIVGYSTASHMYFKKSPKELTFSEACLLAVLPNSPGLMNVEKNREKLIEKRNNLLKKIYEKGYIDERQYKISIKEPIPEKRYSFKNIAPHLVRRLINENKDKKIIKSTINSEIQEKSERIVKDYSKFLEIQGIKNVAVLIINNKNYECISYVGSQDFYDFKNNGQVDGIISLRSPGSLLKPFLYAKSIDEGLIAPSSKMPDVPLYFSNFIPQNADKKYSGMIDMKTALVKSLNIPFVALLKEYGEDKFFYFLKNILEFSDNNPSRYGLSLILGTKEFSMEEIGKLYMGLANYGKFENIKYTREEGKKEENNNKEKNKNIFLTKGASYLTLNTIRNLERPGMENIYKDKNPIFWKTGTSNGRKDGWAAGVTPEYTVVIWTGNFTGEGNPNLTGIYTAGNLLFEILKILPKERREFLMPDDLEKIKVDKETGYRLKYDVPWKEELYPKNAKPLKTSPYYKKIFVNDKGEEIDSRDENFSDRKEKIVLNYPIEVINYFIKENLDISEIFHDKSTKNNLKFIYPQNNLKIIVPKDFDGEKNIIVKIANIKKQDVYWYINKEYMGKDKNTEKSFDLKKGKYEISIVSKDGEIRNVKFQVVDK